MKKICAILVATSMGLIAACGGSSSVEGTPVAGVVADGYLQNALVFMDKNSNYQLDSGEPSATTDATGAYTLTIAPEDVGKYPIVAIAVAGQTIDQDNPGVTIDKTYVLCTPGAGVSGTVSNFISPISTLLREKLEANPGMTLAEATTQLRNQLGMPVGMNILGDYVAGARAGQYQTNYQAMHQVARQMAGLMASQSGLVMNGTTSANGTRFRGMMGQINENLPQISDNASRGFGMNSDFMISMQSQMQTQLAGIPTTSFRNFSSAFRNMTSYNYFWNYSGGRMQPMSGSMGGGMMGR
ncbi:lipoprotein, putative [Geotalea daltonii FRC-32]|uniref:Lipoprotein, putative n=1 Tax=Geotalea daltonii (strain DSM 22248 / JCM 15807 / FRC-32) TaxID=316067 RepID=B9M1R4_GEODF|nr:hypothetical protein [Geotalea daltonii]ACM19210.1 lipoprotein, putative [Geotalea daltonii FRC-32]